MSRALILAKSEVTSRALEAIWELARLESTVGSERVVADASCGAVSLYQHLADRMEKWLGDGRGEAMVLVDHVTQDALNPLRGETWSSVVAMLVLTFPDVRWVFGVSQVANRYHDIPSLFGPGHDSIFDFTGLRRHILGLIRQTRENGKRVAPYIPERSDLCAALDDEPAYAYLHAYTAYRFGLRSIPVIRDDLAQHLLGKGREAPGGLALTLEDVFLSYPDQEHKHYSELAQSTDEPNSRAAELPRLVDAERRLFITSGQSHQGDEAKRRRNDRFIKTGAGAKLGWARKVFKPLGGLYALWEESGLAKQRFDVEGKTRRGLGKGYIWPPKRQSTDPGDTGHSAPGRLALVAIRLIDRARKLLGSDGLTVQEATRGAAFATDALELLGDRTPTSAIEALSLKHQLEVIAECGFSGVEYHMVVKPRLDEIRRELDPLSLWFHRSQREVARLNGEMMILNRLVGIFESYSQFDEAQLCMNRVRHLHNSLWMRQRPTRLALWPLLRYIELLLSSFATFTLVIFGWLLVLAGLYWLSHNPGLEGLIQASEDAVTSFFSVGGPIHHGPEKIATMGYVGVICLAVVSGAVHLGIFISHLYSMLSRK